MGRIFDCDQHMYEPRDAFTRHIEPEYANRVVGPITMADGEERVMMSDRLLINVEPEFKKAYIPGSLKEMLKNMATGAPVETYMFQPMQVEYMDRDARLEAMDKQGLDATIMYPGSWALFSEAYIRQTDVLFANLRSFNTFMAEQWGFAFKDRPAFAMVGEYSSLPSLLTTEVLRIVSVPVLAIRDVAVSYGTPDRLTESSANSPSLLMTGNSLGPHHAWPKKPQA